MPSETSEAISADLSGSLPVVARRASFSRRGSKDLTPHPPSEQREGVAKHGRPPRVVRVNTVTVPSAAAVGSKTIVPSMDLLPQTSEAEAANAEPDEPPEEEVQLEPYTMCGRSGCTILAATFTFFIVDQRLTKLIKEAPAVVAEEPPTDPEPYHRKFDHVKPALPKDIYYRNKRRAAPIRRRMFSNDDAEDELLVENPLVKYLVIDENYCMTYDFPEAMVAVSRIMTTLCNLGYLDAPSNTHHALCDLFAYYNVNFLLDDFEPCNQIISRSVYAFAADTSPKLWRRYQESLQAIRYQDNQQREDELRRFCATVVKFAFDMFGHVVDAEQKFFKMGYSLTVEETDVNVWVRMAEVLNPVFGALAVIVNSTFENTVDSRNRADLDSEAEHAPAAADLLVVPPPAECGLGADMLVLLNRASEHVYSAVSLANGKAGKVEAATLSSQTKAPSAALEVSSDMHPIAEAGLGLQNKVMPSGNPGHFS